MKKRISISVVILNWNGRQHLAECLHSLENQTFRDFEIILLDNGSTDGSVDFVRKNFAPLVRLICVSENLGFAAGNNRAIGEARGKFIALLNNDTVADPKWLEAMMTRMEGGGRIGMCAPKILNYRQRNLIDNTGHLIYRDGLNRGRGRLEIDRGQYDSEEDTFFPSGCAALYRRAMLDEVGLFDEAFFAYGDDTDIGLKGRLAGWRCLFAPRALVYHKYSGSTGHYSPFKAFHVERNRVWIAVKYFPLTTLLANPLFAAHRYLLQAYGALTGRGAAGCFARERSPWELVAILWKANLAALAGIPAMWAARRRFRTLIRVDNRERRSWFRRYGISAAELALKE